MYAKYSIEIESANEIGFLILANAGFNKTTAKKIIHAINNVSCRGLINQTPTNKTRNKKHVTYNDYVLSPRDAFLVGFKNKNKKFNTDVIAPCPPGYAINIPGEKNVKD